MFAPAAAAMPSVRAPLNPLPANSVVAASRMRSRVTAASRRGAALVREEVRKVLLDGDSPARQPEAERLVCEHVDLLAIPLHAVGMEVLAHHRGRFLELGLEP